ncbi:VTT domain-containing protein [uncultured Cytophaga sp.]|uniref:VTT domain-containing protein n=1 Tax=uncultured Cytophaga sp. TaxID=160238 RepID=UPI00261A14C4|nr:VTT domain-containing protein [uncultured Cytophaga sp.]
MESSGNYLKELLFNSTLRVKLSALFLIAMYILPIISNLVIIALFATHIDSIKDWEQSTILILGIVLFFTSSFSITSTTLLSVVCGYLFGWISFPVLLIMFSVGSLLGYFLANVFDKGTIMTWIKTNEVAYNFIVKLNQRVNLMVFVMRLTPILPFTVTNILCSYLSVPLKNYLGMGFIGIGIRTLAMVYTGSQISSIINIDDDPVYKAQKIGFLILSFALFGLLYYLVMKQKDKIINE